MNNKIKTVEVLQISAGLAAALRWAIALMPLDGVQFALSNTTAFEVASFILSLAFAAVEIGATAYIMRAWRKETDKRTQSALMALWIIALFLMTVAQVPPLIANIDSVSVATFPLWLKIAWVTCSVSVTFVVIGGVGYAEKSLEVPQSAQVNTHTHTLLSPNALQAQPLAPLTDHFVRSVWIAKKSNAPFDDIQEATHECLNGTSEALKAWLETGKQSMNELAGVLSIASDDRGVFDATCRGLRKPQGTEIRRA